MRLLAIIAGVLGVVCLVISIILALAGAMWIATSVGWWRMTIALLLLSVALEVVKPFQKKESGS